MPIDVRLTHIPSELATKDKYADTRVSRTDVTGQEKVLNRNIGVLPLR